jgi:hypothetical protein
MLEATRYNPEHVAAGNENALSRLAVVWCEWMHGSPMWPIHGQYECRICGRHYPIHWAENGSSPKQPRLTSVKSDPIRQARVASFRSAVLPSVALVLLLAPPLRSANGSIMDATTQAAIAFARYTAAADEASPWSLESVEIEASLPKLEKQGRLRAVRRLLPLGKPEYRVIETAGDQIVRQQVIVRYLSAELKAADIPASSLAITPANYKFHYKGAVESGDTVTYVFLITPRKKREGLIKGELWLDGETGVAVRESGYLVKGPSIFVKRVRIVREKILRAGLAEEQVTHLSVDLRLVGRAELTIHEHPCADAGCDAVLSAPGW